MGNRDRHLVYLENTGHAASPAFVQRTGAQDPFDAFEFVYYSTLAFGDVDGDGDLDLFVGSFFGAIIYLENTGSATRPAFAGRLDIYQELWDYVSAPSLGDLDGDGDLDVVAAHSDYFRTFYLPEPGKGLLLGAGIALLSLLERLRGRRGRET